MTTTGREVTAWLYEEDGFWTLADADGTTVRLPDGKGPRLLAALVAHPDTPQHAVALTRATSGGPAVHPDGPLPPPRRIPDPHEPPTVASLRARLRELDEDLEEAEAVLDIDGADRARRALDAVERDVAELLAATPDADANASDDKDDAAEDEDDHDAQDPQRARLNVTRALRSTIRRIAGRSPRLGNALEESVRTGMSCVFAPPPHVRITAGRPPTASATTPATTDRPLAALELDGPTPDLEHHDATVRAQATFFGGHAAPRVGRRTLLLFPTTDAAVQASAAIVRQSPATKAAVHVGDAERVGDAISGLAVEPAIALARQAPAGAVVLSPEAATHATVAPGATG